MDFRLYFSSLEVEVPSSSIVNFTLNEQVNAGTALTMGCVCANSFTASFYNPPNIQYDNAIVQPQVYDNGSWVSMGKFWVTNIEKGDYKYTITAYDGISKLGDSYSSNLGGTVTLQAIYDELKTLITNRGVSMDEVTMPNYSTTTFSTTDMTIGDALAHLAGCVGGFAKCDRNGKVVLEWYTSINHTLTPSEVYLNTRKYLTDSAQVVKCLATGTAENPIVKGDGTLGLKISYENPWITDAMATAIYNAVLNLTFRPIQLKWKSPYSVEAGDIVTFENQNVLIMNQQLAYNGGFTSTIYCYGESAQDVEFSKQYKTITDAVKKDYGNLDEAIRVATRAITGNSGGYVVLHDTNNDGKPEEILVMDQPSINDAVNVWRWNQAGLGHSSTGYNGTYDTAITAAGVINANFVAAGVLSGITIRGNTINGNTITGGTISGATIEAEDGTIGGWTIDEDDIHATTTATVSGNTYNVRTSLLDTGKLSYTAWPEGGSQTGAAAIEPGCSASGTIGLTLQGPFTYNYGSLITDTQTATALNIAATRNIYAGTADMTAGTSPLAQGRIYLCYEV